MTSPLGPKKQIITRRPGMDAMGQQATFEMEEAVNVGRRIAFHLIAPGRLPSSAHRQCHRTPDETVGCLRLSNQDHGTTGP